MVGINKIDPEFIFGEREMTTKRLYDPPYAKDISGFIANGGRPKPLAVCSPHGVTVHATNDCVPGGQPYGVASDCKDGNLANIGQSYCVSGASPLAQDACVSGPHI